MNEKYSKNLVSIIVPVFNTGALLVDTVNSLLSQTYPNFEILLIDDGSNAETAALCERLSSKTQNIICYHKANGGICSARNFGLRMAQGKYIAFCDHDDRMMPSCIEKAINVALTTDADIVRFRRIQRIIKTSNDVICRTSQNFEPFQYSTSDWNLYRKTTLCCGYGVWAGLYKKNFLEENKISFDESIKYGYEDHVFTSSCLSHAHKAAVIPDLLYQWIQRVGKSTSTKQGEEILQNRLCAIEKWAAIEQNFMSKSLVSIDDKLERSYYYMDFVLSEIRLSGPSKHKAKIIVQNELKHYHCKKYLSECKNISLKQWLKCKIINLGFFNLYYRITDILKSRQIFSQRKSKDVIWS